MSSRPISVGRLVAAAVARERAALLDELDRRMAVRLRWQRQAGSSSTSERIEELKSLRSWAEKRTQGAR